MSINFEGSSINGPAFYDILDFEPKRATQQITDMLWAYFPTRLRNKTSEHSTWYISLILNSSVHQSARIHILREFEQKYGREVQEHYERLR